MAFVYYNPGLRKNDPDCAVRAVSRALGTDWLGAYDLLCTKGRELYRLPDDTKTIGAVLGDAGFTRRGIKTHLGEKKPTVAEIAEMCRKNGWIAVAGVQGHVVCCEGGDWFDTWDYGEYKVSQFWFKLKTSKEDK